MIKKDLFEKLKDIADDADINETIQGIEGLTKTFDLNSIKVDDFKNILESNKEAKAYYQSALDSGIGKGVAKYKENFSKIELPKLVETGIKAKTNEGKSELEIKFEEQQKEIENMKAEKAKSEMSNKFTKVLGEKGLDIGLIDFVLGADEETTTNNIEKISKILNTATDNKVKEKLNGNSYNPPDSKGNIGKIEWSQVVENPELLSQYKSQSQS